MEKVSIEEFKADTVLSVQDVAGILKINESTVRGLIRSGKLTAFTVGQRSRVKWSAVLAYLESKEVK